MAKAEMNKFYISVDSEYFNQGPYDTREEAVVEMKKEIHSHDCNEFYTGILKEHNLDDLLRDLNIDLLIENIQEKAAEDCGEQSEDWLSSISKEDETELKKRIQVVLKQWLIDTHNEPNFGFIDDVEEHKILEAKKND